MNWLSPLIDEHIEEDWTVLDIMCEIAITTHHLKNCLHVDIWRPYLEKIKGMVIQLDVRKDMNLFLDNSFDVVLCLDGIEHLEKREGFLLIKEMERIARKKVIIFTPDGFLEQTKDVREMGADKFQTHKSGFTRKELELRQYKCTMYPGDEIHGKKYESIFAVKTL